MNHYHPLTLVSTLFLLYTVQSQYQDIWYNNMDSNDGWNTHNDVTLPSWDNECPNDNQCAMIRANNGNSWIDKSTNIAQYAAIQLRFDMRGDSLNSEDFCQISYRYDNDPLTQIWGLYDDGQLNNHIISFPAPSTTTINILVQLGIHGNSDDGGDQCYFDNVRLRGITRTHSPTQNPSRIPTTNPTQSTTYPSLTPTISTGSPTKTPTNYPTKFPTNYPSQTPTVPSNSPSNIPTQYPTKYPSSYPTKFPTKYPTGTPTKHPTEPESEISDLLTTNAVAQEGRKVAPVSDSFFDNTEILVIFILIIAFCCAGCLIILICCKQKRYKKELNRLQSKIDEIEENIKTDGPETNTLELTKIASVSSISDANNEVLNNNNVNEDTMYQPLPPVIPTPTCDIVTPMGTNTDANALTRSIIMSGQITNRNNESENNENGNNNENNDHENEENESEEGENDDDELFAQQHSTHAGNETTKAYCE